MRDATKSAAPWWSSEQAVLISDVPNILPRSASGRRVHVATVYRWAQRGLRGVRLRTFRCGARLATTREELSRWTAAITDRWDECDRAPDSERLRARGLV
ncbi:MAG: DUF1580 domain-containing protein [Planctomycetes bacterium]|nr:DUF1580 domain-containing protein [Planctomycetota bacterium]